MAAKNNTARIARRLVRKYRDRYWFRGLPMAELEKAIEIHGEFTATRMLFGGQIYEQDPALMRVSKRSTGRRFYVREAT